MKIFSLLMALFAFLMAMQAERPSAADDLPAPTVTPTPTYWPFPTATDTPVPTPTPTAYVLPTIEPTTTPVPTVTPTFPPTSTATPVPTVVVVVAEPTMTATTVPTAVPTAAPTDTPVPAGDVASPYTLTFNCVPASADTIASIKSRWKGDGWVHDAYEINGYVSAHVDGALWDADVATWLRSGDGWESVPLTAAGDITSWPPVEFMDPHPYAWSPVPGLASRLCVTGGAQ